MPLTPPTHRTKSIARGELQSFLPKKLGVQYDRGGSLTNRPVALNLIVGSFLPSLKCLAAKKGGTGPGYPARPPPSTSVRIAPRIRLWPMMLPDRASVGMNDASRARYDQVAVFRPYLRAASPPFEVQKDRIVLTNQKRSAKRRTKVC